MVISGSWTYPIGRWDFDTLANVQEYHPMAQTEDEVSSARRVAMVPQTGRLCHASIYHHPCDSPLRQVSTNKGP